jgi:hypothetical protein
VQRLIVAGALVVVAAAVAAFLGRRRPDAPTQDHLPVPRQIDRADFTRPETPWLVAVFTSDTCDSCAGVTAECRLLESPNIAFDEISWQRRRDLHDRYRVQDVPLVVVVDADGVVRRSFVGAATVTDLAAAVAGAQDPTPEADVS